MKQFIDGIVSSGFVSAAELQRPSDRARHAVGDAQLAATGIEPGVGHGRMGAAAAVV